MKFARFEHNGQIYDGVAEGEEIHVIKGSFVNRFDMTNQKSQEFLFLLM